MTVSIGSGVSTPKHWTDFGGVSSPGGASILEELKSAIRQLFITGEQGVWYDPSDFSTLFQDSAGTTPVTAVGQPVGKMLDKSGRGNHATQSTATSRPILQQDSNGRYYLQPDGVDDWMVTPSVDFTSTDKMFVCAGVRKLSDAAAAIVVELTSTSTNNGSFYLAGPITNATMTFGFATRGTIVGASNSVSGFPAPVSVVLACRFDNSGNGTEGAAQIRPRVNGVAVSGSSQTSPGNYANAPLYLFRRAGTSLPFSGRFYGLIVRGAATSDAQIAAAERFMNQRTGAF